MHVIGLSAAGQSIEVDTNVKQNRAAWSVMAWSVIRSYQKQFLAIWKHI